MPWHNVRKPEATTERGRASRQQGERRAAPRNELVEGPVSALRMLPHNTHVRSRMPLVARVP